MIPKAEEAVYREKDQIYWRDSYKRLEQMYMQLRDDYAEVAILLGATPNALWGDPIEAHDEIIEMAKKRAAG